MLNGFSPDSQITEELNSLLNNHQGLPAWEKIKDLPALKNWRGYKGRKLAARLASALGNHRLSSIIDWKNWRENPDNDSAYFQALFSRLHFKAGSLLIPEMEKRLATIEQGQSVRSDLLGLIASCYSDIGEYSHAHRLLDEAMVDCKNPAWLWVQRSLIYRKEDSYDDSLIAILEGKKIKPWYRPVLEVHSTALIHLGRDEEALQSLIDATEHTDSPAIPLRISGIFSEQDNLKKTSFWLDDYEHKSPLLEKGSIQWLAGRRADLCYLEGDIEGFLKFAKSTKKKSYHRRCLKYYKEKGHATNFRKKLDVNFVRQHDMTCAPATLSALAAYFGHSHDHLKIADAICYDGTPWHKERTWCENNGFSVCEFPVTMEATKALIDSDIPFSLTTQTIDSGHLQACIGYDEAMGTILTRDPTVRHYGESILTSLCKEHPVIGLRGLAFVPPELKSKLDSLNLPGQRQYDLFHQLNCAFEKHDHEEAERITSLFRSELPDSPLCTHVESLTAAKHNHFALQLEHIEKLIKRFPKHQTLWLQKTRTLERLSRHSEARDFIQTIHRKPNSDYFFDIEVGEILCRDIRTINLGQFYLKRALLFRPSSSQAYAYYADSLNVLGKRKQALMFRRAASRISRSFEPYAKRYYQEAFYLHQGEEALSYLRERANNAGLRNVSPHLTLLNTLAEKNDPEAPKLVRELLEKFPDNGDLLIDTVTLFSGWNLHKEALQHLEKAKGKVPHQTWLRVAAKYWNWMGERKKSRKYWEKVVNLQPLDVSAHESIARHLAEEYDRKSAENYMRDTHLAHPDYLPLLTSYIEWEKFNSPATSIPLLEKAIDLDPLYLWAIRELAVELSKDKQYSAAIKKAEEAIAYDPSDESSHTVLGLVQEKAQHNDCAAQSFRTALTLNIDNINSFEGLLRVRNTFTERKETLSFVREELIRQVSNGNIVPEYRAQTFGVIENEELEHDLKLFHKERPDLWQTWSALRDHYHVTSQHDLEFKTAKQMTKHFPLLPRSWAELAFASRAKGLKDKEISAFKKAIELSPSWDWILRELSQSQVNLGLHDDALDTLNRAINADPLAPGGYGYKADILWKIDRRKEAIEVIKKSLKVAPLYQWGWSQLITWSNRENCQEEVPELIEEIGQTRSHQWRWWLCLAEVYRDLEQTENALIATEKGLSQEPHELSLLDIKAFLLSSLGRYKEAIKVCQTPFDDGKQPVRLQGREAWILMESGQRAEAWERMKKVSENEPDYYFAHSQLAYWSYDTDSWDLLKKAAQRMIALDPDDSDSWGYLGRAEEELEQSNAALTAYTQALHVQPSDLFSARRKASLEIKSNRLEEASETLNRAKHHHYDCYIIADFLHIELKRCDRDLNQNIHNLWSELATASKDLDIDPYYYTDSLFEETKLNHLYDLILSERCQTNALLTTAEARAWGRRIRSSSSRKKLFKKALTSSLSPKFKASIVSEIIRGHHEGIPKKEVDKVINTHSTLIQDHYDSWSAALEFYSHHLDSVSACRYGALWRNYLSQVKPSSLAAYATFVDETKGLSEGYQVRQEILHEFPQWEGSKFIRVSVAFQKAITGKTDDVEDFIAGYIDPNSKHDFYDSIYYHTLANVAAQRGDTESCEKHFRSAVKLNRQFPDDVGSNLYLNASASSCAQTLNIFNGNPKKLLKSWAPGLGSKEPNISWWWIIIIWIIVKFILLGSD